MKISNKLKIFIVVIAVLVIAIAGIVLAGKETPQPKIVTRDYSNVYFEQVNDKEVDVYLGMNDTASIASFQIGFEIDIADCYDSTFSWSDELKNKDAKFKDVKYSEQEKNEESGNAVENLNLYYVGTEELNELSDGTDIDNIKLGTIKIVPDEEIPERSSYVTIQAKEGFSKTVSLSHSSELLKTSADDIYTTRITVKSAPVVDNITTSVEAIVEGDVLDEGGDSEGAKVVVNFEVTDETNTLTALQVKLIGDNGETYTKSVNVQDLGKMTSVSFIGVKEGKYQVQILGSYTLDSGAVDNEVLKTSAGDNAELSDITVVKTQEPVNPPPTTDPSDGDGDGDGEGDEGNPNNPSNPDNPTKPGNQGNTGDSNNPGDSNNSQDLEDPEESDGQTDSESPSNSKSKENKKNPLLNIFSPKTGGNRSVMWAVILLGILVIAAGGIIILKSKTKSKPKH